MILCGFYFINISDISALLLRSCGHFGVLRHCGRVLPTFCRQGTWASGWNMWKFQHQPSRLQRKLENLFRFYQLLQGPKRSDHAWWCSRARFESKIYDNSGYCYFICVYDDSSDWIIFCIWGLSRLGIWRWGRHWPISKSGTGWTGWTGWTRPK